MPKIVSTLFSSLLTFACFAQSPILDRYIEIQHERLGFSGVILITQNNKEIYHANIGRASHELDLPMNPGSVFKIASISKQFTAMLILLAVEERRLFLADSLGLFFPELKDNNWRKINVHQLLSHTSGLPHNEGIADYWITKSRLSLSKQAALKEIFSMNLLFKPGSAMKYSSPGYFLLACILESVYNQPFETILKDKILKPLQMDHSGIFVTGKIVPGMVSGYHQFGDSLVAPFRDFSLMKGSGDMFSNAKDLSAWNNSFSDNKIWNKKIQQLLFAIQTKEDPFYGYGWYIRPGKRLAYYHGGGTFGTSAISVWYPEERVSLVMLGNVSVLPVNDIWSDIEKIIFNEPFELPQIKSTLKMTTSELGHFAGVYQGGGKELNIILIGDQLHAKLGGRPPFEIYPEDKLRFYAKKVNVLFTFITGSDGEILQVTAKAGEQVHYFNKK